MKKYIQFCVLAFLTLAATILFYFEIRDNGTLSDVFATIFRIARPLVIGFAIAYVLSPMCAFFDKLYYKLFRRLTKSEPNKQRKVRIERGFSIVTVLFLTAYLIYELFALVIPELISSVTILTNNIPAYIKIVQDFVEKLIHDNPVVVNAVQKATNDGLSELQVFLRNSALPGLQHLFDNLAASFTGILTFLIDMVLGIVVSIYILIDRRKLKAQVVRMVNALFPSKKARVRINGGQETTAQFILRETHILHKCFVGFIKGKVIDSLILGAVTGLFAAFTYMPYAVLVSVIIGVTNIIPFFGPWIGLIPSTILILMVDPSKALLFMIVVYILQQIDGNVIGPKILGNATDLDTFWVLFSLVVFGGLFGLVGMFIAIPVFSFLYQLAREWVHKRIADSKNIANEENR